MLEPNISTSAMPRRREGFLCPMISDAAREMTLKSRKRGVICGYMLRVEVRRTFTREALRPRS